MADYLPPPPLTDDRNSYAWLEWFRRLRNYITQTGSVPWSIINFAGSNITDLASRSHQNLQSLQGGTTSQYYHLTQSDYNEVATNLNLSGTSGTGVKVDLTTPTFGWRDLLGEPHIHTAGANDPTWATYRGSIKQYQYSQVIMNETVYEYHIPHDYVPNTDIYVHVHWSQITVDTGGTAGVPGVVKWYFDTTYAKSHGTAGGVASAFDAPITTSVTQQASTTQYGHMLSETVLTGGGLLDKSLLEPDGVILLRMYRDAADVADTLNQGPFVHYVDVHYQSTNIATKNKSPNFYV